MNSASGASPGPGGISTWVTWRPSFRAACQGFFCSTPTAEGPVFGDSPRHADDPAFRDNVLFYEYFHGDTGRVRRSRPSDWLDRPRRATAAAAGRRRAVQPIEPIAAAPARLLDAAE